MLRRAALDTFSTRAWRRRTAARAGVSIAADPAVSVVLATKRSEMLDFALGQVARQRGVAARAGAGPPRLRRRRGGRAGRCSGTTWRWWCDRSPPTFRSATCSRRPREATSGDLVLKMDDDDWYAPDAVADLVRAHHYSGAPAVGMPAEFHYLTEPDLTVMRGPRDRGLRPLRRRRDADGRARPAARGGRLPVGAQVRRRPAAGRDRRAPAPASTATHGLGYVLRRNPTGHTWEVDLDYLLDPVRTKRRWDGFRPSRLMELSGTHRWLSRSRLARPPMVRSRDQRRLETADH